MFINKRIKSVPWIFALVLMFWLAGSCKKDDTTYRKEMLCSFWWNMTSDNGTANYNQEDYLLAFHSDGSLTDINFENNYSSWELRDNGTILELGHDDYKILSLTESELIIKYNTGLGHTYSFKPLINLYTSADGVSGLGKDSATLHGTVRTISSYASVVFEYGLTAEYDKWAFGDLHDISPYTMLNISANIPGLSPATVYHYRVNVTAGSRVYYSDDLTFKTFNNLTAADIDGNVYNTISIGEQTWMAENLKTTRYSNGDTVPLAQIYQPWSLLTSGGRCANLDVKDFIQIYGYFYNWYAASDLRNICPAGWHVPTDADWTALTDYLGGNIIVGEKLKEAGIEYWRAPNSAATNESGFSALPAGYRPDVSGYIMPGEWGAWWSSTAVDQGNAWERFLGMGATYVNRDSFSKTTGLSVRCIKN